MKFHVRARGLDRGRDTIGTSCSTVYEFEEGQNGSGERLGNYCHVVVRGDGALDRVIEISWRIVNRS